MDRVWWGRSDRSFDSNGAVADFDANDVNDIMWNDTVFQVWPFDIHRFFAAGGAFFHACLHAFCSVDSNELALL